MRESEEKIKSLIEKEGQFKFLQIRKVNHRPHRYVVGPKHVAHASDYHGGLLDDETFRKIQCAHPGCRASFEEHIYDKVVFIQLAKNVPKADAQRVLGNKELEKIMKEDKIDGFTFVDTEEKFRVV